MTPCIVGDLEPGERVIHVRGPGDIEATVKATVERGEETSIVVPLEGTTKKTAEPPNERMPQSPPSTESTPPTAGSAPLQETTANASPTPSESGRAPTPMPGASSTTALPAVQAAQGSATLNINSIPVSKVVLDGRPLGNTPKVGVSVSAGSHTVVFVHPDKGKKSVTVTVKDGETKTAAVKF